MIHNVGGDLFQAVVAGDDVVFADELAGEFGLDLVIVAMSSS
ncbi:MAG: hypothetical protein V3S14_16155 [Anaerolineae bacterium]